MIPRGVESTVMSQPDHIMPVQASSVSAPPPPGGADQDSSVSHPADLTNLRNGTNRPTFVGHTAPAHNAYTKPFWVEIGDAKQFEMDLHSPLHSRESSRSPARSPGRTRDSKRPHKQQGPDRTKHYVDLPSPREGSPRDIEKSHGRHVPRPKDGGQSPELSRRRPRSLDERSPKLSRKDSKSPKPARKCRRPSAHVGEGDSEGKGSHSDSSRGAREGSPPRFGERLASKISVIDDDMFRKTGSIRMSKSLSPRFGWSDRDSDQSMDSLDDNVIIDPPEAYVDEIPRLELTPAPEDSYESLGKDEVELKKLNKRDPSGKKYATMKEMVRDPNSPSAYRKIRDSQGTLDSTESDQEVPPTQEDVLVETMDSPRTQMRSRIKLKPDGTPMMSPSPVPPKSPRSKSVEYLPGSRGYEFDPTKPVYDEGSLIESKELKDRPNFELRRRPGFESQNKYEASYDLLNALHANSSNKDRGKYRKLRSRRNRKWSSSSESDQEVAVDFGPEMETRSEASSVDTNPVAGVGLIWAILVNLVKCLEISHRTEKCRKERGKEKRKNKEKLDFAT